MKTYFLFQPYAWWIGVHYSVDTKRFCIQLLPTLTLCFVLDGGIPPKKFRDRV